MKVSKYNIIKEYEDKILVYNSYSKASLVLEKGSDIKAFNNIKEFDKLDAETKEILIENGFIIDDNRDEYHEIKYTYEQKYYDNNVLNITLVPSLLCNFKCPYCCEKDYTCGKENVKKYFEILKKYASKNFKNKSLVQLSLFGGEPLLYAKDCIEFLEWVEQDSKENNYEYITTITTNGSLLTKEIFESLLKHHLVSLQITIDSDKETHDSTRIFKTGKPSFDHLIKIINEIMPLGTQYEDFRFVLRINLNNTTLEKVKNALEQINEQQRKNTNLLIRAIYKTHAYHEDNSNNVDTLKEYFELGTELGFNVWQEKYNFQVCEACGDRKSFNIMPDLSIWKCINDIGYTDAKVGQINEKGDIELDVEKVINWHKKCMSAFDDKECKECQMLPDCFGGCPLYKCKNEGKKSCRTFDMACLPSTY